MCAACDAVFVLIALSQVDAQDLTRAFCKSCHGRVIAVNEVRMGLLHPVLSHSSSAWQNPAFVVPTPPCSLNPVPNLWVCCKSCHARVITVNEVQVQHPAVFRFKQCMTLPCFSCLHSSRPCFDDRTCPQPPCVIGCVAYVGKPSGAC